MIESVLLNGTNRIKKFKKFNQLTLIIAESSIVAIQLRIYVILTLYLENKTKWRSNNLFYIGNFTGINNVLNKQN